MNAGSRRRKLVHPLRTRLRAATVAAILDAAEEVVAEKGEAAASVQDIARHAGVAVGTLYNHFRDRQALLGALLAARRADLAARMEAALAASAAAPFRTRLLALLGAVCAEIDAHRRYLTIILGSDAPRPLRPRGQPPAMHMIEAHAGALVAAGLREGALRPEQADLYPAVLAGLFRGVLRHAIGAGAPSMAGAATVTVELFLRACGAPA